MDLGVTVEAALAEQKLRRHIVDQTGGIECDARMARLGMTALAQQGCSLGQHTRLVGPVRCVTETAVLGRRRVFPEMWPARFRVALLAGIDSRELLKTTGGIITV